MKYDAISAELISKINSDVNDSVQYVTDMQQYGLEEYWAVAGKRGDCEDYALKKLKLLRDAGFPKQDLNLAVCEISGQGHCVLVVRFDDHDDMVLDNNSDVIIPWWKMAVKWIEVSVDGDFTKWEKVDA